LDEFLQSPVCGGDVFLVVCACADGVDDVTLNGVSMNYNHPGGPQLTEFFTQLVTLRNQLVATCHQLDNTTTTRYIDTGTALCAIVRCG